MLLIAWWTSVAACTAFVRMAAAAVRGQRSRRAAIVGRTLADLLTRLGPTYVKLGQLLGGRRDLLGDEMVEALVSLRDDLPPLNPVVARRIVTREIGAPIEMVFSEFANEPSASGSIASVYRARLRDGRPVAVKVLRPDAATRIRRDLELLRRGARWLERLPRLRALPLTAAIDELGACLLRQTDFVQEAAANRHLRAGLAEMSDVLLPSLVDERCTHHILVMDFVEAFAAPAVRRGEDVVAVRAALRALYWMIFVDGVVHCDMHEGNVRCLPGGHVALVDFGFVARLAPDTRLAFAEFFFAMAAGDGPWCADIALRLAETYPNDLDERVFTAEIATIVTAATGRSIAEFNVARFVGDLFATQRRHGVRSTPAFVMAIVSLLVLEGLAKAIDSRVDFQREAMPFIARAGIWTSGSRSGDVASVRRRFSRRSLAGRVTPAAAAAAGSNRRASTADP
jgi:ubiquinone biosynthesis protein